MTISIDLETHPIDRGNLAPKPVCMSWVSDYSEPEIGPGPHVDLMDRALGRLYTWLNSTRTLVGTKIAYDMACIGEHAPDLLPAIFEKYQRDQIESIDLNQKLIDIAARGRTEDSYSLESLCARYDLPSPDKSGPWRLEYAALEGIPISSWPQGAIDYVLADADRPMTICQAQHAYDKDWTERSGGRGRILHLAGYEARKAFALHLISCWGVKTDRARTKALRSRLERYMRHAQHWLEKGGLVIQGVRKKAPAQARMAQTMDRLGIPPVPTAKGAISLSGEACSDSGDGLLQLYAHYGEHKTLMARVEDFEQGHNLPLQSDFDTILETGRTSTFKPRPPLIGQQAQNMPRKAGARECLSPGRPDWVFFSCDLPSAELRSLSQTNIDLQGSSVMADLLNAGKDLHLWFGGQILGEPYEALVPRKDEPAIADARQNAKPCNFGFPGGMGPDKFQQFAWSDYRRKFTRDQCVQLKQVWLSAFPEMPGFFRYINGLMCGRDHALVKAIRSGRWRNRVPYCALCNYHFQEPTATAAADGLCEAQRRMYSVKSSAMYGARTVLYTHDEVVAVCHKDQAHDAAMELSAVMADRFNYGHPDVPVLACTGPTKDPRVVAPCVSLLYSKSMKPMWKEGRLIPWTIA